MGRQALTGLALAHGYDTAVWWTAGIFADGAVIAGALLRPGPLDQQGTPSQAHGKVPTAQATAGPARLRHDPAGRNQHMHGCRRKIGSAVLRSRESPGSGDASSPAWRQALEWPPAGRRFQQRLTWASPPGVLPGEFQPKGAPP
jgi:hypothetical protein